MLNMKRYKLGDLYKVSSGLSKSRSEFGFGYSFVTFKDVFYNFFIPTELKSLANTTEKERASCSVKRGDIFLTRTSETMYELGMSAVALKDYENATFNGFTKRLRLKEKVPIEIDPVFIGYYFRTTHIRNQIGMHATMTTRASLNTAAINSIEITVPGIEIQKRIGEILKSIDDKIEFNRRMNQTLEQMAQTLFRKYFVDGIDADNLPDGWREGKLGEIYRTTSGGTPSRSKPEYYGNEIHWVKSKELKGSFIIDTEEKITSVGLKKSSAKILPSCSVLVAMYGATVGQVGITSMEATCNQAICAILPNDSYPFTFIYQFLKESKEELINRASGSAQQNISQIIIKDFYLVIPPTDIVQSFHTTSANLYSRIESNLKEIIILTKTRDTLLPKLMSGEIDVMQAQQYYESVLS